MSKLGSLKNKKILELGCGTGEASVFFSKRRAKVVATDVSAGMLKVAKKLSQKNQVYIKLKQCSAYKTPFSDESFDIIYAANLLHHVDVERVLREVQRILKKGGIFISWDPLAHNPIINIYRRIAINVRTEGEHPLKMSEIRLFRKYFSKVEYKTTWLITLIIFLKFFFIDRIDPNRERYWKKILIDHKKLEKTYLNLEKIDKFLLKNFPFLERYCWNIIVFAYK